MRREPRRSSDEPPGARGRARVSRWERCGAGRPGRRRGPRRRRVAASSARRRGRRAPRGRPRSAAVRGSPVGSLEPPAAGLTLPGGEALPRHHVRLPDERARLRAHEGHARVARLRRGRARRADADLILFNTCSIREKADERFVAHLGEARALKRRDPERLIGVGGCWAQSVKDQVFRQFPFVDVAFGPGQVHKLAEFLTSRLAHRPGLLRVRGLHRPTCR